MSRVFFALARWPLGVLYPLGSLMGWLAWAHVKRIMKEKP